MSMLQPTPLALRLFLDVRSAALVNPETDGVQIQMRGTG